MNKTDRSKPRLGRGLSSLMSSSDQMEIENPLPVMRSIALPAETEAGAAESLSTAGIREIAVDSVAPNPHQPRKVFANESLTELAASLKSTGIIQPIIVKSVGDGFQLIAGERRLRAAKLAGLATVPAIVRDVDASSQAQMALVENIQREDLNPLDRAESYRSLLDQLGLTQAELATRLGEERSGIANYLRLLNLVEPVRDMVRSGKLSFGHAKLLAGVEDILQQSRIAAMVSEKELSVRQLEALLSGMPDQGKEAGPSSAGSPHIRDLEQSLSRQLGMRVQIRSRGKKGAGRLTINYISLDQFDELLNRLGTQADTT